MSKFSDELIDGIAESLNHIAPLPDNTKLQKVVNKLYLKLRILGIPQEEVAMQIYAILDKHGITQEQLFTTEI